MIIFVGAFTQNYAMGLKGHLPWRDQRMQSDTERLHKLANGKCLVMGERTYHDYKDVQTAFQTNEVLVLSRNAKALPDATVYSDIQTIVDLGRRKELWVIGGGQIFAALLPYAEKMYLTRLETTLPGDTFFPRYQEDKWRVVSEQSFAADERNPFDYTFLELERKFID